jgi:signal transduction histidine kinase
MQANQLRHRRIRPRTKLELKLTLSHVFAALGAALTTAGALAVYRAVRPAVQQSLAPPRGLAVVVIVLVTTQGLLLSLWPGRPLGRRLSRATQVCQAWLRGNLIQRISDPATDELGALSDQLDLLAEHLEQDEQDLNELREYNTRLSDQVRALAVDEERERLARELHDGVKQHLFSLSMTASAFRTRMETQATLGPELQEMIEDLETTSKTVQRELTRLIENLRPGSLEEKGLAAALNDYALLFGAREHVLAYLDVQGNDAVLAPSVAESLYRVAQEALHNVARHARATRVDIQLHCLPEQAILVLRDNGTGFDTAQAHRGLGLGNMQDRMMAIGGRLTIESEIGVGTEVQAQVALTQPLPLQASASQSVRDRPKPTIKNWSWLGQRLVIPVGQTWPWLPADQIHLRRPLVEPGGQPVTVRLWRGFLGLGRHYRIDLLGSSGLSLRVYRRRNGYQWRWERATWTLQHVRAPSGVLRAVLSRNRQPVAALQSQGRLLNRWTEFVYDSRGYSLLPAKGQVGQRPLGQRTSDQPTSARYTLQDRDQEALLTVEQGTHVQADLFRALPLPLLVTVLVQTIDQEPLPITRKEEIE